MIARQSLLVIGNSVVCAMLGYVALFAVARYMGDEILGARAFALSIVAIFAALARLGFPITHTRRLAAGEDVGESVATYIRLKILLISLFIVVALGAAWVWLVPLGKTFTDTTLVALGLASVAVVLQSIRDVPVNTFRGLRLIREREAVLFCNTTLTVLATLWVAVAYADAWGRWSPFPGLAHAASRSLGWSGQVPFESALAALMAGIVTSEAVALLLACILFVRARIPIGPSRDSVMRDYWRFTLPLMVLGVGAIINERISQVMVGFWWDNAELGHFAAASKLSEAMLLVSGGLSIVLLPAFANLLQRGDRAGMRDLLIQSERWLSMLLWPAVVFVGLAATPFLHVVLSDEFLPAAPGLVLLAAFALLASLRVPLQAKAIGLGEQAFVAKVALLSIGADIVLNAILIPTSIGPVPLFGLGATGAALAAFLSGLVLLAAYRTRARAWGGHPFLSVHLQKHAVAAGVTFALFWFARPWLDPADLLRFYSLGAYAVGVGVVYLVLLVALRELRREDVHKLRRLVAWT